MLLIQIILYTMIYPLLVKAWCSTDNSTSNHNELVHESIEDFVELVHNMESDTLRNSRKIRSADISDNSICTDTNLFSFISAVGSIQNAQSVNIKKIKSSNTDAQLDNAINSMESMQNATSKNIQMVFTAINNLIANTNTDIINAINSVEKIQNVTYNNIQTMNTILSSVNVFQNIDNSTLTNIQAVVSAIKGRSTSQTNFDDAVDSMSDETDSWRNDVSKTIKSILNHTLDMIVNTENNNTIDTINTIESLKSMKELKPTIELRPKIVPEGFTEYDGRIVLLPDALGGTHSITWYDSLLRCLYNGALPFIPRSLDDFRFTQRVNLETSGGSGLWLPASDHVTEGDFKWYDGSDARNILSSFEWPSGYAGDNNAKLDCVNIWNSYDNKLEIENCTRASIWPMICEIL